MWVPTWGSETNDKCKKMFVSVVERLRYSIAKGVLRGFAIVQSVLFDRNRKTISTETEKQKVSSLTYRGAHSG